MNPKIKKKAFNAYIYFFRNVNLYGIFLYCHLNIYFSLYTLFVRYMNNGWNSHKYDDIYLTCSYVVIWFAVLLKSELHRFPKQTEFLN